MSISLLYMSVEVKKGGHIKPSWMLEYSLGGPNPTWQWWWGDCCSVEHWLIGWLADGVLGHWLQLSCCPNLLPHVPVFLKESWGLGFNATEYGGSAVQGGNRDFGFGVLGFGWSVLRGVIVQVWVLTIDQVGQVIWLIYKMSKIYEWGVLIY